MKNNPVPAIEQTYKSIKTILEKARLKSFKAVNTAMVQAYWYIGKVIVKEEQQGKQRTEYGMALIEGLSKRLTVEYGHGFNKTNLWYMRQFYLSFQNIHAVRGELTWTHYRLLFYDNSNPAGPKVIAAGSSKEVQVIEDLQKWNAIKGVMKNE